MCHEDCKEMGEAERKKSMPVGILLDNLAICFIMELRCVNEDGGDFGNNPPQMKEIRRKGDLQMRYPEFMREHGTIGFVAPSCSCGTEPYYSGFRNALKKFKELGHITVTGPNCYAVEGIGISNTPKKCGEEINEFFARKDINCLISCGGGELMCEILDFVDFEALRKLPPKWYMGYSDNTNLTFLLTTLCDTASIYGPCAAAFGMEPWHEAIEDAYGMLKGEKQRVKGYDKWEKESRKDEEHPLEPYHVTEPVQRKVFVGEQLADPEETVVMEGRLLGGCMDCLVNLLGTGYDKVEEFAKRYREDGIIWFLESCDLNVMGIRRGLWQMEHAGWFRYTKGFLIGRPACYGQKLMGMDAYKAVTGILGKYQVPVLMDLDIGHLPPAMPVMCGSMARIEARGNRFEMEMKIQ